MIQASTPTRAVPGVPAWLRRQPIATRTVVLLLGILALTASSWLNVPMIPVPMTLQTLAVMLVGALYGWRLGVLTILVWLALGALGLPVLAGGTGGIARFLGPTGGYLLAFPFAGALTGWLAERGWNGERMALAFAAMLIAHALCLLLGGAWLATTLGMQKAVAVGVVPFVPGAVVKSALGAVLLKLIVMVRRSSEA
ncbi:MAG: biotin transporter BioY [Xanthomonadales bacterium]|nr:biotin transporter BioY [Xanthomonadaceae bacterium]MBN8225032.1 biotin transporter BioY [Xanthomonadales bacterium]HRF83094.1 biotin transporter BioY [Pseudoxanthomonas sp.]